MTRVPGSLLQRGAGLLAASVILSVGAFAILPAPANAQGCNSGNVADAVLLNGAGCQASANGLQSTAVGEQAQSDADAATAFGAFSSANTEGATAVGHYAGSSGAAGAGFTAVGAGAGFNGAGTNSVSVGLLSTGTGNFSTAVGGSKAFGVDTTASGHYATALGSGTLASGNSSVALGSTATGDQTQAAGDFSVAVGASSNSGGHSSVSIGAFSAAGGARAVAIGGNTTTAGFDDSVAIGTNATTTRANQFAFGTGGSNYTMAGVNSAESKSFQSGPVYVVTSDATGNLATSEFSIDEFQGQLGSVQEDVATLTGGVAIAMALKQPIFQPGQSFALRVGYGSFEGTSAFGLSAAGVLARFGTSSTLTLDGGLGFASGEVGGGVGLSLGW